MKPLAFTNFKVVHGKIIVISLETFERSCNFFPTKVHNMTQNLLFRFFRTQKINTIFYFIVIVCSFFFIVNIKDFGASWDEPMFYDYASFLPEVYKKAAQGIVFDGYDQFADLKYYGPAYLIPGELLARGLKLFSVLDVIDAWHIINYLVFVMGTICLYKVCQKFTDKLPAMFAAILYFSQPLLLGHSVINPKDIPFASFFLLSIALGLKMIDSQSEASSPRPTTLSHIISWFRKWYAIVLIFIAVLILLDRIGNNFIITPLVSSVLKQASSMPSAFGFLKWLLFPERSNYYPAVHNSYVEKMVADINLINTLFLSLLVIIMIFLFLKNSTKFQRSVFWAGIALGLTTSIRFLGPAAGALVLLIWIISEKPTRILVPALAYILIAVLTMYHTWPYLWGDPFSRFIESIQVGLQCPENFTLLFDGIYYYAHSLPWFYLIQLIGIQVTIPALLLFCIGNGLALWSFYNKQKSRFLYMLPILWFYIPIFAWVVFRPQTYDNFRHVLFIMPAMFIFASLGFTWILKHVKHTLIGVVIGAACILPGFISNINLHPYQYVYYNGLVGWTSNIYERYEADYWGTSLCEAGRYLDSQIDDETRVFLITNMLGQLFNRCTQHTPQFVFNEDEDPGNPPDFAVVLARWGAEQYFFSEMDIIHSISVGKTPLVVIRKAP